MAIEFEDEFMEDAEFAALEAALQAAEASQHGTAHGTGVFTAQPSADQLAHGAPAQQQQDVALQPADGPAAPCSSFAAATGQIADAKGAAATPSGNGPQVGNTAAIAGDPAAGAGAASDEQRAAAAEVGNALLRSAAGDVQQAAAGRAVSSDTTPAPAGVQPAAWGGARASGAALRGMPVPSASMRSGESAAADRRLSGTSVGGGGGAAGPGSERRGAVASPQQLAAELAAEAALAEAQRDEVPHLSLQLTPTEVEDDGGKSQQSPSLLRQQQQQTPAAQPAATAAEPRVNTAQPPMTPPATSAAAASSAASAASARVQTRSQAKAARSAASASQPPQHADAQPDQQCTPSLVRRKRRRRRKQQDAVAPAAGCITDIPAEVVASAASEVELVASAAAAAAAPAADLQVATGAAAAAAAAAVAGPAAIAAAAGGDAAAAATASAGDKHPLQQPAARQQAATGESVPSDEQPDGKVPAGLASEAPTSPTMSLHRGAGRQMLLAPNPAKPPEPEKPPYEAKPKGRRRGGRGSRKRRHSTKPLPPDPLAMQPLPGGPANGAAAAAAAAAAQPCASQLPDLEDFGLPKDRLRAYRRRGLAVTDLTASEWCQQQVAYTLSAKIPREQLETEAMRAGTRLHAELEAQTSKLVEVHVDTWEDFWAVRLLNSVAGLRQLAAEGLTREVYVFGLVQGRWVRGIIDQLQVGPDGRLAVVEHKTRSRPTLPRPAQVRATEMQVALYRHMLAGLARLSDDQLDEFLEDMLRVDTTAPLSHAVSEHAVAVAGRPAATAHETAVLLRSAAAGIPHGGKSQAEAAMFVRYWWQGDGELFAEVAVEGGVPWLAEALERHLSFWSGAAPPAAVCRDDAWKCGFCAFRARCQAGMFYTQQRLCG